MNDKIEINCPICGKKGHRATANLIEILWCPNCNKKIPLKNFDYYKKITDKDKELNIKYEDKQARLF